MPSIMISEETFKWFQKKTFSGLPTDDIWLDYAKMCAVIEDILKKHIKESEDVVEDEDRTVRFVVKDPTFCFCHFPLKRWASQKDFKIKNTDNPQDGWCWEVSHKDFPDQVYLMKVSTIQNLVIGAGICMDFKLKGLHV